MVALTSKFGGCHTLNWLWLLKYVKVMVAFNVFVLSRISLYYTKHLFFQIVQAFVQSATRRCQGRKRQVLMIFYLKQHSAVRLKPSTQQTILLSLISL